MIVLKLELIGRIWRSYTYSWDFSSDILSIKYVAPFEFHSVPVVGPRVSLACYCVVLCVSVKLGHPYVAFCFIEISWTTELT